MRRGAPAILVTLALAGCGGSTTQPPKVAKPPHLPRALAQTLAADANAVAQALEQTDGCTALRDANDLQGAVTQAVADREIPVRLRATLTAAVGELPGRITCNPPPPKKTKPPKPPKHDHGHGHGHGPGEGGG
jgi:hypothetical protein